MKTILLLLFLFSFSNSAYLLTMERNLNRGINTYCINSYSYKDNIIFFTTVSNVEHNFSTLDFQTIDLKDGYSLFNGYCYIDKSKLFGFDYEQFNYLMAFYGIMLSSLIAFGLIKAY